MEKNQRKSGAILSYASIIINTLVQLLYTPFLIKMLGQNEHGLYSLVSSIVSYLTILDLGFGNAIIVYTSKYRAQGKIEEEKKLHGMFFIIFIIIGFIATCLGLLLYLNVENIFASSMNNQEIEKAKIMMLILTFNLAISFSFSIYSSIISAYEKFTFKKIVAILNTILKPVIMLPLLYMGYKAVTMTIVITLINILVICSNYLYTRRILKIKIKFLGFESKIFKEILGYSFFIFLSVIVDKINWSVDQFILGAICGTVAVSIYSIASQINTLFMNLSNAFSSILLPKMSMMVANNSSNEEITNEFIKIGRIQYLIVFLMASGFVLFGKNFIITWAGREFEDAYYIATILILPLCVPLIQNLGISIMQAKNMHKFRSVLYTIIAICNIIISIPLAKLYSGIGSALGTAITMIVGNIIIINIYYHKRVKINIVKFWKVIIKMTIPNIIPIVLIIILMKFINISGYLNLLIFGGIYTILYAIINFYINMNDYEKKIIRNILSTIKNNKDTVKGDK